MQLIEGKILKSLKMMHNNDHFIIRSLQNELYRTSSQSSG